MIKTTPHIRVRPKARTEIRLPWSGEREGGYWTLRAAIGASRRGQVQYDRTTRAFSVARKHTRALAYNLAKEYGVVKVWKYGGVLGRCWASCWDATAYDGRGPESLDFIECECACNGRFHSRGTPPGAVEIPVANGSNALGVIVRPLDKPWIFRLEWGPQVGLCDVITVSGAPEGSLSDTFDLPLLPAS